VSGEGRDVSYGQQAPTQSSGYSKLEQSAYDEIKRRIITCEMSPGSAFTERYLADNLSMSKTPIREALIRLRREKLVIVYPRSKYVVTPVTLRDVRDTCEMRVLLGSEAARILASYAPGRETAEPSTTVRNLAGIESELKAAQAADRVGDWIATELQFHLELGALAGNRRLAEAYSHTLEFFTRLAFLAATITSGGSQLYHEHGRMLTAIADGSPRDAQEASRAEGEHLYTGIKEALIRSDVVQSMEIASPPSKNVFYMQLFRSRDME
jgi:GntR family transcriptional regulator, rspAB operon transcriptional repressor